MKKIIALSLALALSLSMMTACSSNETEENSNETVSTETSSEDFTFDGFVLEQVAHMKEAGYSDVELDEVPERIVCLSTAPVLALYEMGADLIMVPQTTVIAYPEDLGAEVITAVTSDDFDLEKIIDADPGLVLIPSSAYDEYGVVLEGAGIPCYVTALTHGELNAYELIKEETAVFTQAFVVDSESQTKAQEVMQTIYDLDDKMDQAREVLEGKSFLGAMVAGSSFYVQQETSTLGSVLKMLGLENAYDVSMGANMTPLSLETVVGLETDLMIFIASTMDSAESETIAREAMNAQAEVWESVSAVASDDILFLTTNYFVFGGIQAIDSINNLVDLLLQQF